MIDPLKLGEAIAECRVAMNVGTGVIDAEGRLVEVDDMVCAMLRRPRSELIGLGKDALVAISDRQVANRRIRERRTGRTTEAEVIELSMIRGDGTTLRVESVAAPIEPGLWGFVWRDVSPREELRLQAEQLRDLVERMPIGVVIWDATGVDDPMHIRLRMANPAACEAFERDLNAEAGRTLLELFPNSRQYDDSTQALLMRGSDQVAHFPDLLVGDPHAPTRVYTRQAVTLPGDAIALVLREVTTERAEELRRRRLLERIVDTSDAERRELAMRVHDDSVQQIAAATMLVEALRRTPPTTGDDDRLSMMERAMRSAMASLRRLVFELSPPELVESGIEGALRSAADYLFIDTDTAVDLEIDLGTERLDTTVETAVFRIAAEALTNARKHAQAKHVDVRVAQVGESIELLVIDDGVGFDRATRPGHIGVRSMNERAASVGGSCSIDGRPWGTVVHAVVPRTGRQGMDDTIDWQRVAEVSSRTELVSVRLENDSLREANRLTMERATEARRRLSAVMSLWQALRRIDISVEELLDEAARQIADTLRDGCAIRRVSHGGLALERIAMWHPVPAQREWLARHLFVDRLIDGTTDTSVVIQHGIPILFDRRQAPWHSDRDGAPPAPIEPRFGLMVPIVRDGLTIGSITVMRDTTAQIYQPDDEVLLQMLADVVADRCSAAFPLSRSGPAA